MSEQQCPVCKSDSYLNPNIKIFISPCFHRICEQCLYKIFAHGHAPCPECKTPLRRINFISSTFEDVEVEREIKIRKLLSAHFHRSEDEFGSEAEYNDYLEQFENVVFELVDLKNDSLAKGRIEYLKDHCLLLNSKNKSIAQHDFAVPEVKKIKVEEEKLSLYNQDKTLFAFKKDLDIPKSFMVPSDAGGLSKSVILEFIASSLQIPNDQTVFL